MSVPPIMLGQNVSLPPLKRTSQTQLIGDGPPEASTSHAIETQPICWDCNGFYRRLGLPPGSPRIEVARSFQDLDGHRSSALTDAARVLLNRGTKKLYDALPLGALWPDDEMVTRAVIEGDLEVVGPQGWSFYIWGDVDPDSVDQDLLGVWRWMVAFLLWRSRSPADRFAMGVVMGEGSVAIVGFRIVAFVPLDLKPTWEYASEIAMALQRMASAR
jgi:hypothetical protein